MIQWHLQKWNINDLLPHPKNPRQLTKDQERHLSTSMDKFGLAEKLVVNTNGTIIGGHQRWRILKKKRVKEVECWTPDRLLMNAEVEELLIRLNRNHGDFDYDVLANEFEVPDLLDWGFKAEELELLDPDELDSEEKGEKKKKLTTCPSCGCEF